MVLSSNGVEILSTSLGVSIGEILLFSRSISPLQYAAVSRDESETKRTVTSQVENVSSNLAGTTKSFHTFYMIKQYLKESVCEDRLFTFFFLYIFLSFL